ncbi:MAG: helix-turn-helix transcriptional regulator [Gemmatimonadetes bacterium]|nr:helix-turn-helix transcriptional regulator [Gemmatimonadota bacterium]
MASHRQPLRAIIGARLRELRGRAGIKSQEKLGHLAGVHRTYVGRLERGESGVTVDMLAAILAAMSVSLAEFFRPFEQVVRPKTPRKRD